ncbi:unnamed protein product [Lasius platythorax]|uniref:Myb/SANT-like DNA-binding domain-containing protein n=1 Tax=Lasius platythorax TaxID=488582 RepID=A0AAV2NL37_9HYME
MDKKLIEINLRNPSSQETINLRVSPNTVLRAEQDSNFANRLFNIARQGACLGQKNACLGTDNEQNTYTPSYDTPSYDTSSYDTSSYDTSNTPSYDTSTYTPLQETHDDMSAFQEQREIEEKEEDSLIENKENLRWSHEAILLLLEEYRLREPSMSSGKISHKKAWNEIATIMSGKGYNVSDRQCMTRINTMKRTYKTIKDHNAKSGNNKRTWKYYEIMQSFLGEKPYMAPLATISSTGSVSKRSISPSSMSTCEPDEINRKRKASSTDVAEKLIESRRLIEERKERRHMEKIELQTKLLEKLDKFIEKM